MIKKGPIGPFLWYVTVYKRFDLCYYSLIKSNMDKLL